jgi:guanine nucleotide-binding protein subunit alpha
MDESLMLFKEIANSKIFRKASIILFLNKIDLLQEKVMAGLAPIKRYYPDFKGKPQDVQAAQKFFRQKFVHLYRREGKQKELYTHYTNATDTSLLEKTMDSVQQTILHHNLTTVIL